MRKQAKLLLERSIDSLVLSIEHFNRPWDRGRTEAVLILLDRSFELLLKSIVLHKGGKIREPYEKETIGFEKCVRKCISDAQVKCLSEEEGLTIQILNSFRDAAQHDIVELEERELYLYSQAAVTLYKDLLNRVFDENLNTYIPDRVLPISTMPPTDLHSMVEADFSQIKAMVAPGNRKQIEARAKLKSLAIVESSLEGVRSQPTEYEINKLIKEVRAGKTWQQLFPGVSSLQLSTEGTGINVDIRITKREGEPVHLVKEGTPGATVLAVKRVNELDYYNLSPTQLAENLNLTPPMTLAVVKHLRIRESDDYYKEVKIGKSRFKRYSRQALEKLREDIPNLDLDDVWKEQRPRSKR